MNLQEPNRDELLSVLFAEMVVQQANMATIFLGKIPHPQTGKTHRDLDAARLFIDQLEMLEVKTKGNLTREEETLLKQSLGNLRLSYVEAANEQSKGDTQKPADVPPAESAEASQEAADEPRKRFTKKY